MILKRAAGIWQKYVTFVLTSDEDEEKSFKEKESFVRRGNSSDTPSRGSDGTSCPRRGESSF